MVTTLDVVNSLLSPATGWIVQLERPQEVADFFEVGADSVHLVNDIFHANDSILAQSLLNLAIAGESVSTVMVELAVATLIDEFPGALVVGIAPGDVGLHQLQHAHSGLVELDEDTVVDLPQSEDLKDLPHPGTDTIDARDE